MNLPVEQRREWIRSRREQRKLMRRARFRRQMLRYLLLSLLLVIAASGFYYVPWTLSNPNSSIIVKGNKVVSSAQVQTALKSATNKPLYQLNPKDLEADVSNLAAVKHAFVRRYCLPSPQLVVEIIEEFPWATYSTDPDAEPQWVIAESGRLISIAEFPHIIQPELRIYGPASRRFTSKEVGQWANWIAYIEKQTQHKVEDIDLRKPNDVRVEDDGLYLKLGTADASLTRRLGRLASVLTVVQPLKERLEYIDLGLDSNIPLRVAKKDELQHLPRNLD